MAKLTETLRKIAKPALYIFVAFLFILFAWILWGTYKADNFGFGRPFWDWMDLLLVPAALAAAGAWFAYVQKKTELEIAEKTRDEDRDIAKKARELDRDTSEKARQLDREIALERQRQQTLENYLDRMKELLLDRGLGIDAKAEVKRLARTLTLNVFRELEGTRNSQVIQFLQESELLGETEVVDLKRANLNEVNLSGVNLSGANLSGVLLNEANLSDATLNHTNLSNAYLYKANLNLANLFDADLNHAMLVEADLSKAALIRVNLSGVFLHKANLSGTQLDGARNWTAKQLLFAKSLQGATMPNGQNYEEWIQNTEEWADEQAVDEAKNTRLIEADTEEE